MPTLEHNGLVEIMERQAQAKTTYPPFMQRLIDGSFHDGELKGKCEGKCEGKREGLLRILVRTGIELTAEERARIDACEDGAVLDRWLDNVIGAKTAAEVLSPDAADPKKPGP